MIRNESMTMDLLSQRPNNPPQPASELAALIGGSVVRGDGNTPIRGVSVDSTDIQVGEAFIALPGFTTHGANYAAAAVTNGAVAVITDPEGAAMLDQAQPSVVITCQDPRVHVGALAAKVYGAPSEKMPVFGVTGTNGKTTTATLLQHVLAGNYVTTGMCSTIEVKLGDERQPSPRTTLEAPVLQRLCALALERNVGAMVVEVSSHALALGRVASMHFAAAGFTNLDAEHLDFHHTMDEYFATKAEFFTDTYAQQAVICVDGPWGKQLAASTKLAALTVSTTGEQADLMATNITARPAGIEFDVLAGAERQAMFLPIPATVMVQNAMVTVGIAYQQGMSLADIAERLQTAPAPAGRMAVVQQRTEHLPACLVDFAHTTDALARILTDARAITPGKLWVVFGSDGERDWEKRPHMGRAAAKIADILHVTDESPRFEDAAAIRQQILTGARAERGDDDAIIEFDNREQAVRAAVLAARPEDTVIVTGKGPEDYQEIKGVKYHYDDSEVIRAALAEREGAK